MSIVVIDCTMVGCVAMVGEKAIGRLRVKWMPHTERGTADISVFAASKIDINKKVVLVVLCWWFYI